MDLGRRMNCPRTSFCLLFTITWTHTCFLWDPMCKSQREGCSLDLSQLPWEPVSREERLSFTYGVKPKLVSIFKASAKPCGSKFRELPLPALWTWTASVCRRICLVPRTCRGRGEAAQESLGPVELPICAQRQAAVHPRLSGALNLLLGYARGLIGPLRR